jgi:hypothetical protein
LASGATGSSASPDLRPRPQPRPRKKVSASLDLRPRPQPRPRKKIFASPDPRPRPQSQPRRSHHLARAQPWPQEKSLPRPTWASDQLRYRGYIITLLLASCLRLRRNETDVPSKVTPVTGACAHDVGLLSTSYGSKTTSAGSMPHRQLCFYRAQGTSPMATLARVQGSRRFPASHVSTQLRKEGRAVHSHVDAVDSGDTLRQRHAGTLSLSCSRPRSLARRL